MKLRFAAPPTAHLNIAQARIALANWLHARRHGAALLFRLDDADPARTRPEFADSIRQDLTWLGLDWDEEVAQSNRLEAYAAAADRLKAAGRLYPCFENEEELAFKRELRQRQNKPTLYDRAMLKLTPAQRERAEANGKRPYWRFLLSAAPASWTDALLGPQQVKLSALSDPILIRADGLPHPALTAAIDDLELGITHILRGANLLTPTGIQLDIMAALGADARQLQLAHLPQLDHGPASPPTLRSLRNDGIEPAALCATLIGAPGPALPAQLAPSWDLACLRRKGARFDPRRLLAANRAALAAMPFEAAQPHLPPGATPAFWHAVRNGLDLMREARQWWDVAAGTITVPPIPGQTPLLRTALDHLPPEPWDAATWPAWLAMVLATGGADAEPTIRLALTGEDAGPDLAALLPLIGRDRAATRLRLAAT